MAVRTGAGTGVVVSLVVFVLTTVFLLVLTIVFYAGKTREMEAKAAAETALSNYVRPAQRNTDTFKAIESEAKAAGDSVAGYLSTRYGNLMTYVDGNPATPIERVQAELNRFGVKNEGVVRARMQEMHRDLNAGKTEIEGLNNQLKGLNAEVAQKEAQMTQLKAAHQQEVDGFEAKIASYRDAVVANRQDVQKAVDEFNRAKDNLRVQYQSRIDDQQRDIDEQGRELAGLRGRLAELERARDATRLKAQDPSLLVDGKVIDAPGSADQVFIDRGRKDRIVLGMTFEVYANESQLRPLPTGEMPRGKASLQVTKVSETTSTCKITRSTPGQPIVRGDVLANAIYDPTHKFKFAIHGKFDIDSDGKPTEAEADFLRSLVMQWGGAVVEIDSTSAQEITLPGDLDFLVLGVDPPKPAPLPADAPIVVINDWLARNAVYDRYYALYRQAQQAQIPVLNANRFFILIGHTER